MRKELPHSSAGQHVQTTPKSHPIHKDRVAKQTRSQPKSGTETQKAPERRLEMNGPTQTPDLQIGHNQAENRLHPVPPLESIPLPGKSREIAHCQSALPCYLSTHTSIAQTHRHVCPGFVPISFQASSSKHRAPARPGRSPRPGARCGRAGGPRPPRRTPLGAGSS